MRRKLLLFLSVLCLLCTANADVRYALNPEGFESGAIPSGWTQVSVEGTGNWQVEGGEGVTLSNPTGAKSGNYRVAIRQVNGTADHSVTRLITPAVDLTDYSNPQLHFAYAQASSFDYFDTLRVYYRTTATAAWTLLQTFDQAAETWKTAAIELPAYLQGTAYQIAFEASDHAGKGVVLDDISIWQPSQCVAPKIVLMQPSSSTAYIEYMVGGTGYNSPGDYFDIVVSDSVLADPAAATAAEVVYLQKATTETSLTLSRLKGYTTYYVYLRTNCSDNESGYTDWVSGEFKTTMLKSLPFSENFNYSKTTTDYYSIAGWTFGNNFEVTNTPYVYVGTSTSYKQFYSVDSTSYLAFSKSATQATAIDSGLYAYAATPELDGNLSECEVSFWGTAYKYVYNGVTDYASELTVGVMEDPTDFTSFTAIKTVKVETAFQFKHFTVSLSGYTGTGRYVALVSNAKSSNLFFVDNLEVKQATVAVPEDVRAYNAVPTGFDISAQLWGADSWNVKVSTTYMRDASLLADSACLLNQTGLTGATYHVNSANIAGKTVMVYVQAVKNGVASAWSFPVTLRVPTAGVVPIELTMNTDAYTTIQVCKLNHEIHGNTTNKALGSVYFAPRGFDGYSSAYFYPEVSTSSPTYDGGHLNLNGVDNYFAFPYMEDVSSLMLSFRLSVGSYSTGQSRVAVGVMTDPYDLTTFEEIEQFDGGAGTYVKCEEYLSEYSGTGHYVAIRALEPASSSSYGSWNALDNIVLKTIPSCLPATDVKALPAADGATLKWKANGMSQWLVSLYSNSGYTTLLKDTAVTKDSVVLSGLTPNTTYYYTVRTICGTDTLEIEDADQKYSFKTAVGIPFVEKFSSLIPDGWTKDTCLLSRAFAGATPEVYNYSSWSFSSSLSAYKGTTDGYYAYIENYGGYRKHWLVTPDIAINANADASVQLTFEVAMVPYSSSYAAERNDGTDDQFAVLISTDGGNTWLKSNATVWNNLGDGSADYVYNDIPETLKTVSIDMTKFIGQTVRVAFYAESTVSNADNYILIDNVKIATYDANCAGIKTLSATATGENTASVVWTVGGEQSAHIDVIADGEKTAFFSGDVTTSPYLLSGLSSNTGYTVYAYQSCNAAGDTLTSSFRTDCGKSTIDDLGTITFSDPNSLSCWTVGIGDTTGVGKTTLTAPARKSVSKFGYVLYMEKPKKTTSSYYGDSYYGNNYYAILPPLDIDSIAKYQVVFDAATTTAATDTVNVKKLYVGVITDPSDLSTIEITDTLTLQYAADSTAMKSYAIGFDNYEGDYLGDYGTYVVFMVSAPEAYNDIAIIDNVHIEPVVGCHQVLDLTATDIKVNSATLKWTSEAGSFRLVVSDKLCNPDTVSQFVYDQVVTDKTATITGLAASSNYYAYIKAICGVGDSARWSGNTAFKTTYGVPYLEPFAANSLTNGTWNGYKTPFGSKDTLDITGVATSTDYNAWYMTQVPSGVVGLKDYAARVEVWSTGSYDALLVSPQISLPEASESEDPLAVSFVIAKTAYSSVTSVIESSDDKFSVFVSEDGKKWARSASTVWASDGSGDYDYNEIPLKGKRYRIDLSAYKGKAIYLGFFTESTLSAPDTYFYLDSVKVDYYQPTCDGIISYSTIADKISTTTAALNVKSTNASDTIEYVLGVDSVNWATAVAHHADSTLIELNGLTPSTTYCVYARTLCSSGDTSAWAGPITFTTGCLETLPLSYNFDDKTNRHVVESGASQDFSVENCWNIRYSNYYYAPTLEDNTSYNKYSYSGTSAWKFYKGSGEYMLLAMPEVDTDLDELQLSFMARAGEESSGTMYYSSSSNAHSVEVGTMDNLGDTATFQLIKEVVLDPVETGTSVSSDANEFWRQQIISLEGATGKYIVFLQRGSKSNYFYIDDVTLSKRIDCDMVEKVTVDSIHSTSARAHWTSEGSNFFVTIASSKDTTSFATTDTVCALTGLTAHTTYSLQVVSVCGTDTTIAAKTKFTTLYALPMAEDFTSGMPSDWSALDGDVLAGAKPAKPTYSYYCWEYTGSNSYGINAPKVRWNLGATSSYVRNSLLITPQVDVNAAATNQVLLSFDMALTGSSSSSSPLASYMKDRKFAILVSEDDGTTWNKIDSLVWGTDATYPRRFDSIPATSTHYSFDISAYNGKTIRLAFYAYAPATYGYSYLHLTNIVLREFNPNCLAPESLTATDPTQKGAALAWKSPATKFELQVATDKKCTNVVLDSITTDTTLVLNTLNIGTHYYARVRSLCGANEYSDWSDVCAFATSYGLPFVEEFTSVESYIPDDWAQYLSLSLNSILNTADPFALGTSTSNWSCSSSNNQYALSDKNHVGVEIFYGSNYKDSWLLTPVIDLSANDKDYIAFSFDAALTYWNSASGATTTGQQFYVVVSEDAGQTWNKANVIAWSDAAADSANYTMASIPSGAGKNYKFDFSQYAGKSIQIAFGVTATSNDSRLHIDNIRLEGVDNVCFGPKNVALTTATATTATIEITPAAVDSVWQYAYLPSGTALTDATERFDTKTTKIALSGLETFAAYDVYVRSICGVGDTSEWSSTSFITATVPPMVEEFSNISTTESLSKGWSQYKAVSLENLLSTTRPFASAAASTDWGYSSSFNANALTDGEHVTIQWYYTYTNNWMVSPLIDLTDADTDKFLKFSFDAASTYNSSTSSPTNTENHKFYVAVSEDAGQTWTKANVITWSDAAADSADYTTASIPNGAGKNYKFDFSKYSGKVIQIAFGVYASSTGSYSNRLHLDNIRLEEVENACFGVKGLTAIDATSTTATIGIAPAASDKKWQYAYLRSDSTLQNSTKHFDTDTTVFTITGLKPSTEYSVYVRSICGVGDTSEWVSITTRTGYVVPFAEDFDNVATEYPAGWTRYSSLTPSQLFSTKDPFETASEITTGAYFGYLATYNAYAFNDDPHISVGISSDYGYYTSYDYWAVSPKIELAVADTLNAVLTFDAALTGTTSSSAVTSAEHYFYVAISTDGGHTWKESDATIWSNKLSSADYKLTSIPNGTGANYTVNLTKYAGKTVQIAFCFGIYTSSSYEDARLHLDNIHVNASADCFDIEKVDLVSASVSELGLQIANTNRVAKEWQYVAGKKGFSRADSLVHTVNTPAFSLTGLQTGTSYDVYVRSICGSTDTSAWVGPFAFSTSYAVPFLETFDSISTSTYSCPDNWKRYTDIAAADLLAGTKSFATAEEYIVTGTTLKWGYCSVSKNGLSDKNHIGVNIYSSCSKSWLLTPVIDLSAVTDPMVIFSFDAALTKYNSSDAPTSSDNQKFYILVSEDAGNTWSRENAILWSNAVADSADYALSSIPNAAGQEYVLNFTKYIGKNIQIAFGIEATSNDNYLHIDNINLYAASGICFAPTKVTQKESTLSSLKLTITDDSNESGWQYAYGKEGFTLSGATAYPTDDNEIELTGLSASTYYDVYVRTVCGVGDTSKWVGPFTFSTSYGIPFSETFEDMASVLFPVDWKRYTSIDAAALFAGTKSFATETEYTSTTSSSYYWSYNSYNSYALNGDGNHISAYVSLSYSGSWAVTPVIDLSAAEDDETLIFSFDAALTESWGASAPSNTDDQKFYVLVSEDGGATWSSSNAILWSNSASDAKYRLDAIPNKGGTTYHFDFSKYAGKNIQIAFGVEATSNYCRLHIDNVNLYATNSLCFGVQSIKQTDAKGTMATVSFTETSTATQWQYAYGETGFTLTDQTAVHRTDSTAFTITGLQQDSYYDVYVRSVCAVGDTSAWAGPCVVKTAYGVPYSETFDDLATVSYPADWKRYRSITPAELFSGTKSFATASEATSGWTFSSYYGTNAFNDENHISIEVYSGNSGSWTVTPIIDLSAGADDNKATILSFDAALTYYSSSAAPTKTATQSFYVAVSEDGGKTWSKNNATVWGESLASADYLFSSIPNGMGTTCEIDLSKYTGKCIQVAFGVVATSNDNRLNIDNFSIRQIEKVAYTASLCNSSDYQDDHFSIARADLKVGETTYTTKVAGQGSAPDTAYVLTLTVYPAVQVALYDTICQGYTYDQNGFNFVAKSTTVVPMVLTSVNGCDSLVELHLEVIPTQYGDTTIRACQSYTYKGVTYYSDKIFTDTLASTLGCDSIVRTFLRISSTGDSETEWRTSICSGDSYTDEIFAGLTKAGVYKQTVQTAYGCDSTVTLYLLVADDTKAIYDTIQQADLPYLFEGEIFLGANTKVGDYTHDIQSSCGQVTLNMHVTSGTGISNTSIHSLQLTPNPARIGEPVRIITDVHNAAEYALSVISSTGQLVYESHTPALTMPGLPIAGIYTVRLVADGKVYQTRLLVK